MAPLDRPSHATEGLLERETELAALAGVLGDARAGDGRVVLIDGRAGAGKTSLLAEARRLAAGHGMQVLSARGSGLEREFAFGVVRQLFEARVLADGEALLAGAAAPAARVFESPAEGAGDASFAALHGLYWLTANVAAAGPLLIAIDDLHWCDAPSLRYAVYLARRLEGLPVVLAAALRSSEPGTDPALLAELSGDPATFELRPAPLSEDATGRLIRERLHDEPDERFRHACHHATGGNPLLTRQLLSSLALDGVRPDAAHTARVRDIGPRAASRTLLARLARLPREAIAVARALAVLGDGADVATVAALAEVDERTVAEATRELVRLDVLGSEGFVHPLVRDAVYHDLSPAERELLHAAAARLLRSAGAPAQEVAAHLLVVGRGGPLPAAEVTEVLEEAARAARARGAPESAVAYLRRALAEPPDPELVFALGQAEALVADPAAIGHLRAAYDALTDPARRAAAAQALGQALLFAGPIEETSAFLERAIAELPGAFALERSKLEVMEIVSIYFGARDWERIRATRHRTTPPTSLPEKFVAAVTAIDWAMSGGTAEECARLHLSALEGGELLAADDTFITGPARHVLALADREEVVAAWEDAIAHARRHGALWAIATLEVWGAITRLWRGELAEAEALLRAGVEGFAPWEHLRGGDAFAAAYLALTLLERGDPAAARRALEGVQRPTADHNLTRVWLTALAELLLAEGRAEEALEVAEEVGRRFGRVHAYAEHPEGTSWRTIRVRALDRLGRSEEALALLRAELELARHWGAPATIGRALRLLGEVRRDSACLQEAVSVLAGSTARLEAAKAELALGRTLRRERRPTEAREPLRRALELAERCSARGLAETARSELYAAGARPRRAALSGVESLTTSERRVADLAAAGRTNRDIAQTLYVTPKTVEMHLGNVYRKLGIRSRTELRPALEDAA